jgi:hypothetical protein
VVAGQYFGRYFFGGKYEFKMYFCMCRYFYLILRTIVPGSKTPLVQKLFWFVTATMALSSFGPYHGLWHKDAPSKHIDITPTLGAMQNALGLGVLMPQPKLYHTYGTAGFFDYFFENNINELD